MGLFLRQRLQPNARAIDSIYDGLTIYFTGKYSPPSCGRTDGISETCVWRSKDGARQVQVEWQRIRDNGSAKITVEVR